MLKRSANEVKKYRLYKRIIPAIMGCLAVLVGIIYVVAVMYTRFGSFTVSVDKYHMLKYGLALSEHEDFHDATASLNTRCSEVITNIDGHDLDKIPLGGVEGSDNGSNYLCYTFYCKNTGEQNISFDYSINITNMSMGIEKAVRVRLITTRGKEQPNQVDYAWIGVDSNGQPVAEQDPYPTESFYSRSVVMLDHCTGFEPGEINKYTVVIWLEGNDPDCVDDIIGGEFKIDMKFSVVSADGADQ